MAHYKKGDKIPAQEELAAALKIDDKFYGAGEAKKVLEEIRRQTGK